MEWSIAYKCALIVICKWEQHTMSTKLSINYHTILFDQSARATQPIVISTNVYDTGSMTLVCFSSACSWSDKLKIWTDLLIFTGTIPPDSPEGGGHNHHHHHHHHHQPPPPPHFNPRIIQTVPAKEPKMNAMPLKSVLKKPKPDVTGPEAAKNGNHPNNVNNNNNHQNEAKSNGHHNSR